MTDLSQARLPGRPRGGSRRKQRARRRSAIVLGAIVAILITVIVTRVAGDGDDADQTTVPTTATAGDDTTTTVGATSSTVAAPQLVASDASGRRYTMAVSPFTVQLGFTSLCWVEARRGGSTGELLVADAFNAGAAPQWTESAIWIRLGNPGAATVTVNGVALPPTPGTDPVNIEVTAGPPSG